MYVIPKKLSSPSSATLEIFNLMHVRKLMSSTLIFCCDASSTRYMTSWPTLLPEPWTSLEELHLCFWSNNPKIFKDVDLHMSFPNLTLLNMGVKGYRSDPFMLPDLSGCERLESITLEPLHVSFQSDLKEKVTEITLHGEYLPLVIYSAIQNKKLISKVFFFHFMIDRGSITSWPQEDTFDELYFCWVRHS